MINEVEGLSALTLHDSHANLFDVLIAWLFALKGTGGKNDFRIFRKHLRDNGVKAHADPSEWSVFHGSQAHK